MTRRRLKITPVLVTLNVLVLLLIVAFYSTRMIKYYLKENGKSNDKDNTVLLVDTVLKNYRGYGIKKDIEFENLDLKKVVVKEPFREFQRVTKREYQCVNSYKGRFILRGDNEDLNDIYKLGLGFKRGQGFGNLEVVNGR